MEILTMALGGLNVVQLVLLFRTMKSHVRKEQALAEQEKANSVEKSQTIYDRLTEIMNRELGKMDSKIQMQDKTIFEQATELKLVKEENFQFQKRVDHLQRKVEQYETSCAKCVNNKIAV